MRIFTSILLGLGIFLITLLSTSILEYCSPGSVSWVMREIDWCYTKFWVWTLFTLFLGGAIVVIGWFIVRVLPVLARLVRRHLPLIMTTAQGMTRNPQGRRILMIIGGVILAVILLVIILVGVWVLLLIF